MAAPWKVHTAACQASSSKPRQLYARGARLRTHLVQLAQLIALVLHRLQDGLHLPEAVLKRLLILHVMGSNVSLSCLLCEAPSAAVLYFELPDVSLGQQQVLDSVLHVTAGVGSQRLAGSLLTEACQPIPNPLASSSTGH